jgi:hypothetical protein
MNCRTQVILTTLLGMALATACGSDPFKAVDVQTVDSPPRDATVTADALMDGGPGELGSRDGDLWGGSKAGDQGTTETAVGDTPDVTLCLTNTLCAAANAEAAECHAWACNPAVGCVEVPLTGQPCDDIDNCSNEDQCLSGQCVGQPLNCSDSDPCTQDSCDPLTGCRNDPTPGAMCDDGDACTQEDKCVDGACGGAELVCADANPCTLDVCNSESGCVSYPLTGNPCDDGSACTDQDQCLDGDCVGTEVVFSDGNPCTEDICNPVTGWQYEPSDGADCNDGNDCTDKDQCLQGVCVGQTSACDDGNPCTIDTCNALGGCIHIEPPGLPCDDGDGCTTDDQCYQGQCVGGPAPGCDDGEQCTEDSCDSASGCVFKELNSTPCDDGSACTTDDFCTEASCTGTPISCEDGLVCTDDTCDPAIGCVYAPAVGPCDDDDACTEGDFCANGQCQPGNNPQCLAVKRVVLAGDSWSTGLIGPMRDAFDDRGYEEVPISWELTSKPGSKVNGWVNDSNLMNALYLSLDVDPPAEILFFTLSGNDFLGACKEGLGILGPLAYVFRMTLIQWDLQTFVNLARAGRPNLKIVLIGYDYLHFEMIQFLGNNMPGLNTISFNLALVDLATRARDVSLGTPNMLYAHNMGLLQHTFGDYFHPLFLCPNPVFGCPEYGPGEAPAPGPAPGYDPFPGGWYSYPSPVDYIPDGIHPNYDGFRVIFENTLDQGAAAWVEGN